MRVGDWLPIDAAAQALGVPAGTVRRWCREGLPHRPGRRGRGHAALVQLATVRAWQRGGPTVDVLQLAQALPARIAQQIAAQYAALDYPAKRADARVFAACWFVAASATLDVLRELDSAVPEIDHAPEEIKCLQKIAQSV